MYRFSFLSFFSLPIILDICCNGIIPSASGKQHFYKIEQDTLLQKQILYNGRIWRNQYYKVRGNQFLFSKDFLPGTVTIKGQLFDNVKLRYDINKDEITTISDPITILQLNKEMVDMFSILFENKWYKFERIPENGSNVFNGYLNVLYKGKTALYVKYRKEIELLAEDGKYDRFYQSQNICIIKDGIAFPVTGKKEFFIPFNDKKRQIKNFINSNKLKISKKVPESFIPVLEYYDNLGQ